MCGDRWRLRGGEAAAQSSDFELGFIVGEPTWISAKAWQSRTRGFDFAAAWSFGGEDVEFGIRFPVGLDYLFPSDPIDIFFELVPILDLVEETDFEFNASLGARYWF